MGTFVVAASVNDFTVVQKKKVVVQGYEIMLAKVGGNFYAIDSRCAHMQSDLSSGTLEGTVVTCPRHGSQYDITDGHNVRWLSPGIVNALLRSVSSPKPVRSYRVKVLGDSIMVEV